MHPDSIALLDDIREFDDLIAVDYRPYMQETRTVVGLYGGLERADSGAWYLVVHGKVTIRTIDLISIRKIKQPEIV